MTERAVIAPVVLPHRDCEPGCPLCPADTGIDARDFTPPVQGPAEVRDAVSKARKRRPGALVEVAFYGGDLWALPRGERTALLDAAEGEVRAGRASGVRVSMTPQSVLRAPLGELVSRGVVSAEVAVFSVHRETLVALGLRRSARVSLDAIGRLHRARLRAIAVLMPGLPMSSHHSAMTTVEAVIRAGADGVRLLPALALGGTRLGAQYRSGRWVPMEFGEAVTTCREQVRTLRAPGFRCFEWACSQSRICGRPLRCSRGPTIRRCGTRSRATCFEVVPLPR